MKIKTLLVLLFFFVNSGLRAQELHFIMINGEINNGVDNSDSSSINMMTYLAQDIVKDLDFDLDMYMFDFNKKDLKYEDIWRCIDENMKVSKDDIVIVYYAGHGGRSKDDKSESPQLIINEKCIVNADSLTQVMLDKGARFNMFMYDTSNILSYGLLKSAHPYKLIYAENKSHCNLPKTQYSELFSKNGYVVINSASMGQHAFKNMYGSLFVLALKKSLENCKKSNWEEFLRSVSEYLVLQTGGKQKPSYRIHLH